MFSVFVHTKRLTQIKKGGFFAKNSRNIFLYCRTCVPLHCQKDKKVIRLFRLIVIDLGF